jgi:hypothetical protein
LFLRVSILLIAVLATAPVVYAANPIDTDGPDYVESSEVVGRGHFQFETDFTWERDRRNGARVTTFSTPTLLRFGVAETVELRVETEGWMQVKTDGAGALAGNTLTGTGDTAAGLKWHSQDRNRETNTPAVSWIFHLQAPTGSDAFKGHGVAPSLRSVITWELPHDLALGFMPGIRYGAAPDGHRFASGIVGLVLNKQWTEKVRTFVENTTSQIAHAKDGGVLMSWDVGAAYLVTNDWQIGFRAGVAANKNTPNEYLLLELAGRF